MTTEEKNEAIDEALANLYEERMMAKKLNEKKND